MTAAVAVVGGGPAGLMAAEVLSAAGVPVHLFDAMPSVGRKFLLAGKGGLNLTHSEDAPAFVQRYGARAPDVGAWLHGLDADAVRAWARSLCVDTFVGTSGRVFPTDLKAAPLLRAWLHRLRHPAPGGAPVQFHMRHRWTGWSDARTLCFDTPHGAVQVQARAVVLALGGASWARLGSDGAWVPWLAGQGVPVMPLQPANCGFDVDRGWSDHFRKRFAGQPFKTVALSYTDASGHTVRRKGEFVATATGVEGSLIYAASAALRDCIVHSGSAAVQIDLLPDMPYERVLKEVQHPRGSRTLSSHLKSRLNLQGIKTALLHEVLGREAMADPVRLAQAIKAAPLVLGAARPIDEAISTAGGVAFDSVTPDLMLKALPGVFCAGEMLDWEAPTGGYLLTACLASGRCAGQGVLAYLRSGANGGNNSGGGISAAA
ncbi:MAG: TIGR03862 family flavoprotein [Burkholderiaceae bacterium]